MAKKAKRDDCQLCEMFANNNFSNTSIAKTIEEKYVGIKLKLKRINQSSKCHYTTCLIAKQTRGIIHQVGKALSKKVQLKKTWKLK